MPEVILTFQFFINLIIQIRKPVSISFNVMSLINGLQVDDNGLDLFTMQSAKYEQITTKFTLSVVEVLREFGLYPAI